MMDHDDGVEYNDGSWWWRMMDHDSDGHDDDDGLWWW